ncbi:MAG TPA: permease [Candidatus Limivivens merdigallinarum]|uniref:Permease n=1 Tax=Candidatus Limivivens merdigallinarum TaxID=2840859 RepID=A0A9D0ZVC6_9FIRM|nr:permease [Candidatus Limivivens merdigallinarum]
MLDSLRREGIYLWYYFSVQLEQVFRYWVLGMVIGSAISVFAKDRLHGLFRAMAGRRLGVFGVVPASLLGIASPLCMYGTIPIAASFARQGMRHDWLAAFMMSSILLNPQLILYSGALGTTVLWIRIISCCICGMAAGWLVGAFYSKRPFFDFRGFEDPVSRDTHPNLLVRFLKNLWRNVKATGPMFLLGVVLSALFQRYVPSDWVASLFGENEGFGVLLAATIGVPLYACGGGTIPLLQAWLIDGMSLGSAAAFMITGPATKITNLGALKTILGFRHFALYLIFVMGFSLITGLITNWIF